MPQSTFRAVLFDFFGTLTQAVSRGPAHTRIARDLGCDPAELAQALNSSFYQRACGQWGAPPQALNRVLAGLGVSIGGAQLSAAVSARVAAVRADTQLRPDAVGVLRAIRQRGLRLGLVSDCGPELPAFLPDLPIAPLLSVKVYSIEVGVCKPNPAIYLAACRNLGVFPDECLYLGDGGSRELTGARALGMTAIRLDAADLGAHLAFEQDDEWDGPVIGSLAELLTLVEAATRTTLAVSGPPAARRNTTTGRSREPVRRSPGHFAAPADRTKTRQPANDVDRLAVPHRQNRVNRTAARHRQNRINRPAERRAGAPEVR